MLSVPEPLPNDPEDVVSALEFAEHYGKQGDLKEAVRWVRRAAEIAGDTGSDERALTLARAVADLNISASQPPQPPPPEEKPPEMPPLQAQPAPAEQPLQAQPAPAEQPPLQAQPASSELPAPPPLPGAGSAAYDPDGDAETRVVDSAHVLADFQKQSNGNGSALSTPIGGIAGLAPLATSVPTPVAASVPTPVVATVSAPLDTAAETVPEPPPAPPYPAPSASMVDTAPGPMLEAEDSTPPSRRPVNSMAELLARKEAEVSSAIAAAEAGQPADTTWDEPPPPPPPPQPSFPPVERRTAHPAADRISTPLIPSQPYLERAPVNAPIHQAVRASIVATAEPGVFVLRVLTAEQGPAPTGHEVLVVVTDSNSSPFKS